MSAAAETCARKNDGGEQLGSYHNRVELENADRLRQKSGDLANAFISVCLGEALHSRERSTPSNITSPQPHHRSDTLPIALSSSNIAARLLSSPAARSTHPLDYIRLRSTSEAAQIPDQADPPKIVRMRSAYRVVVHVDARGQRVVRQIRGQKKKLDDAAVTAKEPPDQPPLSSARKTVETLLPEPTPPAQTSPQRSRHKPKGTKGARRSKRKLAAQPESSSSNDQAVSIVKSVSAVGHEESKTSTALVASTSIVTVNPPNVLPTFGWSNSKPLDQGQITLKQLQPIPPAGPYLSVPKQNQEPQSEIRKSRGLASEAAWTPPAITTPPVHLHPPTLLNPSGGGNILLSSLRPQAPHLPNGSSLIRRVVDPPLPPPPPSRLISTSPVFPVKPLNQQSYQQHQSQQLQYTPLQRSLYSTPPPPPPPPPAFIQKTPHPTTPRLTPMAVLVSLEGFKANGAPVKKHSNQDRGFIHEMAPTFTAFAVFDGHGEYGDLVANFVSSAFQKLLNNDFPKPGSLESYTIAKSLNAENVLTWLRSSFTHVDVSLTNQLVCRNLSQKCLTEESRIDCEYSGCTASVAIRLEQTIYIAYVGDSKVAGFQFDGRDPYRLIETQEHNPAAKFEMARIRAVGASVTEQHFQYFSKSVSRIVEAGLSVSRAFGDLAARPYGVISEPEFVQMAIPSPKRHSSGKLKKTSHFPLMLIVATDGLWDTISPYEILEFVSNSQQSANTLFESLRQIAEVAWRRRLAAEGRSDDTTAILALLSQNE